MKKSTCKIFLGIAIVWIIVFSVIVILTMPCADGECEDLSLGAGIAINLVLWNLPGLIFGAVAVAKWNSEEETKDERAAKLAVLKRAKAKVEIKGKI